MRTKGYRKQKLCPSSKNSEELQVPNSFFNEMFKTQFQLMSYC